jgi:C1A family cysteine protease
MRRIWLGFVFIMLIIPLVSATVNLDFRLDIEDKLYYPNNKVLVNVSVINRDVAFDAKDAELTVYIGDREYSYKLGDLKRGETFKKKITLPEFPPGTQNIKGIINYTGILDERFSTITYNSFEVLFPPIERYPRNVYVSDYNLPEKFLGGKTYDVSVTVTNDGEVGADLLIEVGSLEEFVTKKASLNPGESKTVSISVSFNNTGISLIEARVYALINGEKYLLNYRGHKAYVQPERVAKLSFDKLEFIDEPDNEINQNDQVKFKIYLKNDGYTASQAKAIINSSQEGLIFVKSEANYEVIIEGDSYAPSNDFFEIKTENVDEGNSTIILRLSYVDSESRTKELDIPINIKKDDICGDFDNDGYDSKTCADADAKPNADCNDYDAKINPGVKDVCDGINNDCDDKKDEDADCGSKKSCVNGVCCFDVNNNGACDDKISCDISCTSDCEIPNKFDWRDTDGSNQNDINENWMTPVQNQGNCGSCWAFSAVGTYEANYKIHSKDPTLEIDLSEQQLTSNSGGCCAFCGDCGGGLSSWAFKYIKEKGIVTESCFPYTASTSECNLCTDNNAKRYTLTNYERVPGDFQSIKRALICKGVLSVGSNNWGHAIVLVGYDDEAQTWIIKNSWSKWWGSGGYGKINYFGDAHSDIVNRAYFIEGLTQQ